MVTLAAIHRVAPGATRWIRGHLDVLALFGLVGLFELTLGLRLHLPVLDQGGPAGIQALGIVDGARLGLQALGVVLVLRSNRIINFAQVQLGAVSGLVFWEIWRHNELAVLVNTVCPSCLGGIPNDSTYLQSSPGKFEALLRANGHQGLIAANFWMAMVIGLMVAPLISYGVYTLVIRRFEHAPRMIATVVTIALAQLLVATSSSLPSLVFHDQQSESGNLSLPFPDVSLSVNPTVFHLGDILTVVMVGVLLGVVGLLFVVSGLGVAMRAAAENSRRSAMLGINVTSVASVSWLLAGLLSGVGAILAVIQTQGASVPGQGSALDVATLAQILAAVVLARLVSLPLAVAASVVLGLVSRLLSFNLGSSVPFQGLLFLVIAVSLLGQTARQSRAEQETATAYLAARESRPIPRVLRNLHQVDAAIRYGALVVAGVVLLFPFAMPPYQVNLATVVVINAILGLSLLVLTGWAGQISLGQLAFAAVGGYVASLLAAKLGMFVVVALLGGGLAGAAVAVLVGLPALRLRGVYLAVTTMAFALATSAVLLNADYLGRFLPSTLERSTLLGFDMDDEKVFFFFTLMWLFLSLGLVLGLRRGRIGRTLIACRDNEQAGQSFGVNLLTARLEAFALSGFLAAIAGGLLAYHGHGIDPATFAPEQSVTVFLMIVIGGLGSVAGPLLGATYNGVFVLFTGDPLIQLLAGGVGVLAVLMVFPGGLSSLMYQVRDAMLRRVAVRQRIPVPSLLGDRPADALDGQAMLAPKRRPDGAPAFIPVRYRLAGQWSKFDGDAS